ncbi:MAG: hypothetical protein KF869_00070 [Phycisphaeraceae bacterium]|nr:hypothetical protein [Phycisphaeraceae bacterium]
MNQVQRERLGFGKGTTGGPSVASYGIVYQCLVEHCSNVTQDEAQWRVPRLVLENVRKQQVERVRQFSSGVRPA